MHVIPKLIIDGFDASRYLLSAHCEMTANQAKDPGKYDLVLANVGGIFFGKFAPTPIAELDKAWLGVDEMRPKKKVSLEVTTKRMGCQGNEVQHVKIFAGEIQKAEADEVFCRIEGSCTEGGMSSYLTQHYTFDSKATITYVVETLLKDYGVPEPWHIYIPAENDHFPDVTPEQEKNKDFDLAFNDLAATAHTIYFFDEDDEFWFVPAADMRGFQDLTGRILRGSSASTAVGYCNVVNVFGGSPERISWLKTHSLTDGHAEGPAYDLETYGRIIAPPVNVPNADKAECQRIAENLLQWYLQYKNVPQVRVVGKAPGLLSKVRYLPWNGHIPPVVCGGTEEAEMDAVMGLVTRRVVDISADGGFVCTLDVATNFIDAKVERYSDQVGWQKDPKVENKQPGVEFV